MKIEQNLDHRNGILGAIMILREKGFAEAANCLQEFQDKADKVFADYKKSNEDNSQ
jgi:hypothetical protein